jgi:hypothetical protein
VAELEEDLRLRKQKQYELLDKAQQAKDAKMEIIDKLAGYEKKIRFVCICEW